MEAASVIIYMEGPLVSAVQHYFMVCLAPLGCSESLFDTTAQAPMVGWPDMSQSLHQLVPHKTCKNIVGVMC